MSTRTSDAIRLAPPTTGGILTPKQELAWKTYQRTRSITAVAEVIGKGKSAASRLVNRARQRVHAFSAAAAVGGDPVEALEEVRKILAV
jgi:transposase